MLKRVAIRELRCELSSLESDEAEMRVLHRAVCIDPQCKWRTPEITRCHLYKGERHNALLAISQLEDRRARLGEHMGELLSAVGLS